VWKRIKEFFKRTKKAIEPTPALTLALPRPEPRVQPIITITELEDVHKPGARVRVKDSTYYITRLLRSSKHSTVYEAKIHV